MRMNNTVLPRQRLSYRQKTKEWRKDNLDYADRHSFYNSEKVRQTLQNKIINLNLYNGIVDVRDLTNIVNPNHIDASFIPDNIPHHPIMVPKIDLLVGEESKRRFDWSAIVTNPDAVSKKEEEKKEYLMQRLAKMLEERYSDEELEVKMQDLEKYMKYDWQDLREKMANQILRHYWEEQKFSMKFVEGFKDALIMAEEIYRVDVIHDEPVLEKLNPLKVYSVRSGNSNKIEDSSIIIIEDHWSPNKIIDYYHDQLKPSDIDEILEYSTTTSKGSYDDDDNNHTLLRDALNTGSSDTYNTLFDIAEINGHVFSNNYTDENGNVRVLQVYWKSLKKIKKIKYYDEFGETQYKIMSEEYTPIKELGEEVTDLWVNEWWEGVKIGKEIYLNMIPCKVQYNKINNPSYCHPGIIGQVYNTNQGKAVSLVDRAKNYQYMYDAVWDRLNKAIATNYGKIANIDLAGIPDGWEIEKWMHFAVVNKIAFRDSFKEGNQGASTGKLAGGMNVQNSSIDMGVGSYIQEHVQLLEHIKGEMGEIVGISKQREGQISNRETVGGVERSVNQSNHITELWFLVHEDCKLRVMNAFLEAAKVALKGNNKKVQYILDDQTIEVLNIEGDEFAECDYGILVSSTPKIMELDQLIKQLSQSFVQNGGSLSTIMDVYLAPSLLDMKRKLEDAETKMQEQQSEQAKEQNEIMRQQMEQEAQNEQAERTLKDMMNERDNMTKLEIAMLKSSEDGQVEEDVENPLDREKVEINKEKVRNDHLAKMKALRQDMEKHNDQMKAKKIDQSIARIKKKSVK